MKKKDSNERVIGIDTVFDWSPEIIDEKMGVVGEKQAKTLR